MKIVIIGTIAKSIFGFRAPLIKSLINNGHNVYVFANDFSNEDKKELFSIGVIPVDYDLSRSGLNPISDIKTMFYLKKKFLEIKPDLVFSYFVKPVIFGTLAAKLANVESRIAMLEGLGFVFTKQPDGEVFKTKFLKYIQVFLYKISLPQTTRLIFLNQDDREDLIIKYQIKAKNIEILGGIGLSLIDFPYKKPNLDNVTFLFIGRLLKEKGIFEFLEAAEYVKSKFPFVKFIILGETDITSPNALPIYKLTNLVERQIIEYPGQVLNVKEWIEKSSVFVLPSYREGLPRSTQEAMAIGRPIITTNVPGCKETVVDGLNGFLIEPFNINELISKMIWFVQNKHKIEQMGLASREIAVNKFDIEKINSRLFQIMGL
jgi:glycosyltransferase involved in cell wall biosynthesis